MTYESNADRQRAYRQRQRDRAAQRDMLPLMTRHERADLRAALLEAAALIEAAPVPKRRGRRAGLLLEVLHETPKEAQRRKADQLRALVVALGMSLDPQN